MELIKKVLEYKTEHKMIEGCLASSSFERVLRSYQSEVQ